MKKIITILAAAVLLLASCTKETIDGAAPVITTDVEQLTAIIDADLTLKGTITAENGMTGFTIVNEAYGINQAYDFQNMSHPAEYAFLCEFSVPSGLTTDETIVISVQDAAGKTAQASVPVKFLKDTSKPEVVMETEASVYVDAASGKGAYTIGMVIQDDQELDYAHLRCGALGIDYTEKLYGSEAEVAYVIETLTDGEYDVEVSVCDKTGNHTDRTVSIVAVTDTEDPVLTLQSAASVDEILDDGQTYTYTFKAEVSDNVALKSLKLMSITPDWSTTFESYEIDLTGLSGETIIQDFTFTGRGEFQVYYYLSDMSTSVQSWGNDIDGYIDIKLHSSDTDAPKVEMTSPAYCQFGTTYTLRLTVSDESGIAQCWPKVCVYNENGVMPREIADNWSGWWPEVSGTECSVEQPLTFTETGTYKVWIDPITDLAGNVSEGKEWFTINVK